MLKPMPQFVPTIGAPVDAAAEVIPGRASIFSSTWRQNYCYLLGLYKALDAQRQRKS